MDFVENSLILSMPRFVISGDPIQDLERFQGVFVCGVFMIEIMLGQVPQPAKLRQYPAQKTQFVHLANDSGNMPFVSQDGSKICSQGGGRKGLLFETLEALTYVGSSRFR